MSLIYVYLMFLSLFSAYLIVPPIFNTSLIDVYVIFSLVNASMIDVYVIFQSHDRYVCYCLVCINLSLSIPSPFYASMIDIFVIVLSLFNEALIVLSLFNVYLISVSLIDLSLSDCSISIYCVSSCCIPDCSVFI